MPISDPIALGDSMGKGSGLAGENDPGNRFDIE